MLPPFIVQPLRDKMASARHDDHAGTPNQQMQGMQERRSQARPADLPGKWRSG